MMEEVEADGCLQGWTLELASTLSFLLYSLGESKSQVELPDKIHKA